MADNFNISDVPEGAGPKSVEVPGDIADGTAGELLTWDAAGVAALVAAGSASQILTSNGAGAAPTFQAGGGGAVTSVFGRVGAVVAAAADYAASLVTNDSGVAGAFVDDALDNLAAAIPPVAPVDSVFGRVGTVLAAASDYAASEVVNDSGVAGAFVDDALDNLAAAIPPTAPVDSVFGRTGTVVAASGDYSFLQLSDSPASYAGAGGDFVKVNAGATALEFGAGGGGGFTEAVSAFDSGDTAVPNTTNTVLPFDSENFDTDGMHDNSTDNSRITIQTSGTYIFGFDGRWENDGSGFRRIQLRKNGSTIVGEQHTENVGGSIEMYQCVTFPIQEAVATDFFEILAFQNSGGALDMEAATPDPTFWAHRLS